MKRLVVQLSILLFSVKAMSASNEDKTMFSNARQDIKNILNHSIFSQYRSFNIVSIRQGELGEAMAYFVTLEKPFQSEPSKTCFIFQSKKPQKWDLIGKPGDCQN